MADLDMEAQAALAVFNDTVSAMYLETLALSSPIEVKLQLIMSIAATFLVGAGGVIAGIEELPDDRESYLASIDKAMAKAREIIVADLDRSRSFSEVRGNA